MTSHLDDVYACIDVAFDRAVEELADLVRIPGVSAQPSPELLACAEAVMDCMRRSGLSVRLLEGAGAPAVYGECLVSPALPTVLFYGHYDVQPADPDPAWRTDPFDPVVRDGRMYGRGTSDNKGQHLAQLCGLRAVLSADGELPVNVKVLIEGEEEVGSPHLPDLVREHRNLLRADVAITSDGPVHRSGRPQLVLGTRGQLGVELRTRGANQETHSGSLGGLVPDPSWPLVHLLAGLRSPDGQVNVTGFYDAVRPPSSAEQTLLATMPIDLAEHLNAYGLGELPGPAGLGYYERLMFQPTMTITGLGSGYTGPGVKTLVPSTAVARLDMRLVPDQDPDTVFRLLQEHVIEHDASVEVTRLSSVPPSRTPATNQYVRLLADACAHATGMRPFVVPSLGSTLPNHVFTDILGMPSVLLPYANPDQCNHAPNENFELARYKDGMRTCAAVLFHLATGATASR